MNKVAIIIISLILVMAAMFATVPLLANALPPEFIADKTVVEVGETVTFTILWCIGAEPYKAEWDFDGDGKPDITVEGTKSQIMLPIAWVYHAPGTYSVILVITDSTPIMRWEERPDYITVTSEVAMKGDGDGDGDIDFVDFVYFAGAYGSVSTDLIYNVIGDFDDDGDIDFDDFVAFAAVYGYGT